MVFIYFVCFKMLNELSILCGAGLDTAGSWDPRAPLFSGYRGKVAP